MSIQLLFYTGGTALVDSGIRWATRSRFTHVAIWKDPYLVEAVPPRIRMLSGVEAAQRVSASSLSIEPVAREEQLSVASLECLESRAWEWLINQVGQRYSIVQDAADACHIFFGPGPWDLIDGPVCSQVTAFYLLLGGRLPVTYPWRQCNPGDLAQIWTGMRRVGH